ncbi:MAG: hypothetical protein J2P25_11060 [Nocardiopsaceae bacterium]|nr:hypothetical protein [Nocardiopsaceae bacterium]
MLRAARELLAVRSPLDAELMVSELLGTWWGERHRAVGGGGVERVLGEGLVEYAAGQRSPAALALLSGIACLGTPHQAVLAERAAIGMMEAGIRAPGWADHLGAVTPAECYVNPDRWGDQYEVICVFSYAGEEPHALVCVVDYNADGMLRDGWVTSRVSKLLQHCREASSSGGTTPNSRGTPLPGKGKAADGDSGFREIDSPLARRLLKTALDATDDATDPPVGDSFASYHAFIRARIRTLPPAADRGTARSRPGSRAPGFPQPTTPDWSPGPLSGRTSQRFWTRERRALLAAEFLASDEAEDLSDRNAASRCADRIIDFGCDQDCGRPLRVSPLKARRFLLSWVPRRVMLSSADREAMPHVLVAWVRWAGRRRRLSEADISEIQNMVFDSIGAFSKVYRDFSEFGLDEKLVARLLPDSDLAALPRRVFAFPVLEGKHGGVDLSRLNPADPADRRLLLAADHDTRTGSPSAAGVGRHIEGHLEIADRLWRGTPPALWDAAQRLLDSDSDRHLVLHALMEALETADGDEAEFEATLRALATGIDDTEFDDLEP